METKIYKNITGAIGLIVALIILILVSALIVGSLTSQSTFTDIVKSNSIVNETGGYINGTGYTLDNADADDFTLGTTIMFNATDNSTIESGNYTVTAGVVTNATAVNYLDVWITYDYTYTDESNYAGVNVASLGTAFGAFVTALIGFLGVMGAIIAIVWLLFYIKPLFSKKDGVQSFAGS